MTRSEQMANDDQAVHEFALKGEISEAEIAGGEANGRKWFSLRRLRLGFAVSFGEKANYLVFPKWLGGLIIQFGLGDGLTTSTLRVNFPIAFNQRPSVLFTGDGGGGTAVAIGQNNNLSASGFDWTNIGVFRKDMTGMGSAVPSACFYLAIGR
mgnify:CR=1 FL=1